MTQQVCVYSNVSSLQHAVANAWVSITNQAIHEQGQCHIALSGGSTPKGLFALIASDEYRDKIHWQHCHLYFGDERYVPQDHADSNFRMASEAMINQLPIPLTNVHAVKTDINDVNDCATAYENELITHLPLTEDGFPVFDLMLQGVGDDGHTASLFPGTSALHEQHKKVTAVYVEKFDSWRISVTFPVIDRARHVFVLAAGEGKKAILHEIFMKPAGQLPYPIQMLKPQGEYVWYVDEDAAANISGDFIIRPGV